MMKMRTIRLALLVSSVSLCAAAQTTPPAQPSTTPVPAYGQNAPILNPENPPVTSLDEPTLELKTATRSFIAPAIQVSESADTNGGNQLGSSGLESVTRVLGAVDLQQFWQKTDVFLEYLGGGAFYSSPFDVKQLQALGFEGVTRWRTGQVTLHDAFSYLPDGTFSIGTFGGVPGLGLATGSIGGSLAGDHVFGNGQLGAIGTIPRLANTAILDAVQAINPVSAITFAGGFSNAHFYDSYNPVNNPDPLVNSDQITVQAGYTRLLSRHDQLGFIYGFQLFQFPQLTGGELYNHIVNVRWSHTISGRMSLVAGAGPQKTVIEQNSSLSHWSLSGRVQLHYKFTHSSLVATYEKFTSAGSGFFAGADTQAVRLGYKRPLGRTWDVFSDLGYSHNHRLQPANFGVNAASYDEGSAGAVVRKHFGREYDFFIAYRFSEVAFNIPSGVADPCVGISCGNQTSRHVGTVGIEWHPSPTRIE